MFKILIVFILTLRISLFFFPSFKIDMNDWKAWSAKLATSGQYNFYSPNYFSDYFPGYLYILWSSGSLFNFLSKPINSLEFEIFIKSITTMFDIGSAFFIYKIVLRYNKFLAKPSFIFYLLNPAILFNSSVWGQIDGIFTFFLILSSYYLLEKKKIFKSSFFTVLGILVKPHTLAIFPIFLIHASKNFTKLKLIKSLVFCIVFLILLSLPFFPKNPIFGIFQLALKSQNVYPYTSLFAFNLWGLIGWWKPDNLVFIFSFKIWGVILYILSMLLIILPLLKEKIDNKELYLSASLSFLSFYLFLTRIHERYLFPFLAFILIASLIKKSKLIFSIYITASLIHFINLWYVYYYYNYVYSNPVFANNFFYNVINNNYKTLSLLMVVLFCVVLTFYYQSIYAKKN